MRKAHFFERDFWGYSGDIIPFTSWEYDARVHHIRQPFQRKPDFGVTSVNYDFAELLARTKTPT